MLESNMLNYNKILILGTLLLTLSTASVAFSQNENRFIRRGNSAFEKSDFQQAEIEFRKALERNNNSEKGEFNLGGALYKQENFEEAARKFGALSNQATDAQIRSEALYNLGNSFMNLQQYEAAIEAFKNSLRLNPNDFNSKYNLEYAMNQLREQQQQEQNQQNQDQNQESKEDQEQQQNDKNDQQADNQQDTKQDSQSDKDSQSGQKEQQQNQQDTRQISKEDAERMLQALRERERQTLDKIKRERFKDTRNVKTEKDW